MEILEIIMKILGGMGAFLIGMKILSENMTRLAHGKLKAMLNKTSKNRFAGVGIGATVTVIGQSSALTTVMVVGLVNAGLMTLFQATSIIMGANIGTTLTAWIVSLAGFSNGGFDITVIMLSFTAIGMFMTMFSKNEKIKTAGYALAALGLIFVGLKFISGAVDFKDTNSEISVAISSAFEKLRNPFLLLLIGIVITALVQSSMAVTVIIIGMTGAGLVIGGGGNAALYIIIGSNIGTCVTALISSLGANTGAKRAALIHFMFNLFGAVIFMALLLGWGDFADVVLKGAFKDNAEMQIAMFHTLFNVVNALLFLPFINVFVWLANHIIPDRKKKEKAPQEGLFVDLDDRLLRSPSVALGYLYQETGKVFSFAMSNLNDAFDAFLKKDKDAADEIQERNRTLSEANRRGVSYLVKLSSTSLVMEEEKTVSALHYVLNDIMRVAELADNVTKYTRHYVDDDLVFSDEFLNGLSDMYKKVKELYGLSLDIFLYKDSGKLQELDALEDQIDQNRKTLIDQHIVRLNEGKCQPQNSSVFINLVGNLERAADHITYIAHSIE